MSTPIEKIGLSGPALGALRKAKVKTLEAAAAMTDEELLAIPRFGPGGLATVRGAMTTPAEEEAFYAADLARHNAKVPAREGEAPRDYGNIKQNANLFGGPVSGLDTAELQYAPRGAFGASLLAERILMKLLERAAPSPAVVTLAWDLAVAFDQDRGRGALVHDGMRVTYNGQKCVLRTSFKAGEAQPAPDRVVAKALLVKADG